MGWSVAAVWIFKIQKNQTKTHTQNLTQIKEEKKRKKAKKSEKRKRIFSVRCVGIVFLGECHLCGCCPFVCGEKGKTVEFEHVKFVYPIKNIQNSEHC